LCSQILTYKETSQQTPAAPDEQLLAEMCGTKGPESTGYNVTMPIQIEKPIRRHNKPKKAHDYVVAPEGTEQFLLCPAFAKFTFSIN
jgi:hypothetical protein